MFKFLEKLFKKSEDINIELPEKGISVKIRSFSFDDEKIMAKNVDGVDIILFYKDIFSIYIMVDNDFLPFPMWTIQAIGERMKIRNDLENTNQLFFDVFKEKLEGYSTDETQREILNAMTSVYGFYPIWQRHDADEIFKSIQEERKRSS